MRTPILSHDGRDLAAALQTIKEIGDRDGLSEAIDAAFPGLLTLFGGRQSARTIHFLACFAFIGFVVIHLSQVVLTGLWNNLRSMLTGWYAVEESGATHGGQQAN